MTRTDYKSIDLMSPVRAFLGRGKVTSIEAVNSVRLVRIQDGPLDFFLVEGPNVVANLEVPASNVAAAQRSAKPVLKAKGGKADDAA